MKKLKELRLSVGTGQPDYPGTSHKVYNGYMGGMLTNADTSASRRMQVVNNKNDFEEESEEENFNENEDDMILKERKTINGKFSLLETLENIREKDEEIEEESYEEIDLDEFSTTGSVAIGTAPLGKKGDGSTETASQRKARIKAADIYSKKLKLKEKAIHEQFERMRILEAYHQKTTNKLK
jgi:hypothetical protein